MKVFLIAASTCTVFILFVGMAGTLVYQNNLIKQSNDKESSLIEELETVKSNNNSLDNINKQLQSDIESGSQICADKSAVNTQEILILGRCLDKLAELVSATANEDQVSILLTLADLQTCEEASNIISSHKTEENMPNQGEVQLR